MPWTRRQFQQHVTAARLLEHVRDEVWAYLRSHRQATEREVQGFALRRFRRYGLRNELSRPIVAFRQHTGEVHYFPPRTGSLKLRLGTWLLLDLWARLDQPDAPYADLTWMAYAGERIPSLPARAFHAVRAARDASLEYLGRAVRAGRLPTGWEVDAVARRSLSRAGFSGKFLHSLGHSLGLNGPHGSTAGLTSKNRQPLVRGMGYTIEPGVYLAGRYGARCEMNFFLSLGADVVVTTELQHALVRV